eukprot:scaffold7946_cov403-Prasinococcus_capsulatus_cf.AAC.1
MTGITCHMVIWYLTLKCQLLRKSTTTLKKLGGTHAPDTVETATKEMKTVLVENLGPCVRAAVDLVANAQSKLASVDAFLGSIGWLRFISGGRWMLSMQHSLKKLQALELNRDGGSLRIDSRELMTEVHQAFKDWAAMDGRQYNLAAGLGAIQDVYLQGSSCVRRARLAQHWLE